MDKKITSREFYNDIISLINATIEDNDAPADNARLEVLRDFAQEAVAKLDDKNAKRKPSKDAIAAGERRDLVIGLFEDNTMKWNRDEVAERLDITQGQATSALTEWVKRGMLKKESVKVGKSTKTYYSLVA